MKTGRSRILLVVSLLVMTVTGVYTLLRNSGNDLLKVEVVTFKATEGWGYEIKVDNKTYIHQETIPALPGERRFLLEQDALKTGNAVMKKLLAGKRPSLSYEEVMALGLHSTALTP
ncbi:MAG TPA: DUF4907 domain-containing protein [Agriterribacter sp.]|nr:DUF4907 domain-containing protein [Agriterribacter sp.]HRQ49250.1 DUF4907 domain-containing protein [Agriterribacter sp.]